MLNRREKQRIKSEEKFRASLTTDRDKTNSVWSILNSAFVIWLLSTVVIGGLAWIYGGWQESLKNEEAIYKLDLEVDGRFEAAENSLPLRILEKEYYPANDLLFPPGEQKAIHPEFANRNLKSLLYELKARVPSEEQGDIMLALVQINSIQSDSVNKELSGERMLEFQKKLYAIHHTRWKWDKMSQRELHIYDRPNRWMLRLSLFLLILLAVLAIVGSIRWYRN